MWDCIFSLKNQKIIRPDNIVLFSKKYDRVQLMYSLVDKENMNYGN